VTDVRSTVEKSALFVIAAGTVCWLGGINVRAMIGFTLLQFGTLEFKSNIQPTIERTVYSLVAQSSFIVNIAYVLVVIAAVVYLRTTRFVLKKEGWLMISAILFFIFIPVEIYTMVLDVRMWLLDMSGSNDLVEFRKLFIHRLAALSGVPMIALLSYYTVIGLAIVRPLRRGTGGPDCP